MILNLFSKVHHKQVVVHTFVAGFTDEKYCLDDIADFDVANDRIELLNSNSDGVSFKSEYLNSSFIIFKVCITGLYFNDNQILVGKNNDQESFWMEIDHVRCDEDHMTRVIQTIIFLNCL